MSGQFRFKNSGNRSTGAVELRNLLRDEARKVAKQVDQVVVATVRQVAEDKRVYVLIDGFSAGNIYAAGWGLATQPAVGQRVTMVAPAGGQEWYVVGVLDDLKLTEVDEELEALRATNESLSASLASLALRVAALENG